MSQNTCRCLIGMGHVLLWGLLTSCAGLTISSAGDWQDIDSFNTLSPGILSELDLMYANNTYYVLAASTNGQHSLTQYKHTTFGWEDIGDTSFGPAAVSHIDQINTENIVVSAIAGTSAGKPTLYQYDGFDWDDISNGGASVATTEATFLSLSGSWYVGYINNQGEYGIEVFDNTFETWDDVYDTPPLTSMSQVNAVSSGNEMLVAHTTTTHEASVSVAIIAVTNSSQTVTYLGDERDINVDKVDHLRLVKMNDDWMVFCLVNDSLSVWEYDDGEWEEPDSDFEHEITDFRLVATSSKLYMAYRNKDDENNLYVATYTDDEWALLDEQAVSSDTVSAYDMIHNGASIVVAFQEAGSTVFVKTFE